MIQFTVPSRIWLGAPVTDAELRTDGNGFTMMRWILASTVMFSHAWDLTQSARGTDPSVAIFGAPISRLAVYLFFSLSGYLVINGLLRRGVAVFLKNRALRLIPGLWVMLIVVPILLWSIFGETPAAEFFTHPETLRYIFRNAVLIGGAYSLPGIFDTWPFPAVNGSLWTIPHEVRCYIALALLVAISLGQPRHRLTAVIIVMIAIHLIIPTDMVPTLDYARKLGMSFFIGVLAWLWRDNIPLSWPLAFIAVITALFLQALIGVNIFFIQIAFGYFIMLAAFRSPMSVKRFSQRLPDYSYGIYIYAFPMQQIAIGFGVNDPLMNIFVALAMTLPVAAVSWHLIEKPALAWK